MENLDFDVTKQTTRKEYNASTGEHIVNGSFETNAEGQLASHNGTIFAKDAQGKQGAYICNFNLVDTKGADGKNQYSVSPLSTEMASVMWGLIGDVDAAVMEDITPTNE